MCLFSSYTDGSGAVHPPRVAPKSKRNIGSNQEDFLVLAFPCTGQHVFYSNCCATCDIGVFCEAGGPKSLRQEDQYEQLPSHSHLSGVAGTVSETV